MIMSIQISIREDDYVSGIVTIRNNEDASNLDAISMVK